MPASRHLNRRNRSRGTGMIRRRSRRPTEQAHLPAGVGPRRRTTLALASTLAAFGALALAASPAFAANQTLKISVTGPGIVSGAGIGCGNGATCETEVEEGTAVTLTANHSERTALSWEGCETENGAECTLTIGAAPIEVKAEFTPIAQQELKVQRSGEGALTGGPGGEFTQIECGTGTETCHAEYNQGATFILYANRDPHNKFTGWEDCPKVLSSGEFGPAECEVLLTAATEVKASFEPIPQQDLSVEVIGEGELQSSPTGIACTASAGTCAEHFDQEGPESTVTLFSSAAADNHFKEWQGACSGEGACEVTMTAAKSVKAVFAPTLHTLTATPSGPGSISATTPASGITGCEEGVLILGQTCSGEYQEGSTVTLTAAPAAHNHVTWGAGECKAELGPNHEKCELEIGPSDAELKATFSVNLHTLTVAPSGAGSVGASTGAISDCPEFAGVCSGEYPETSTVTLLASPFPHHHVTWTGCEAEPTANQCELQIATSPAEVKAQFAPNTQILTVTPSGSGSISADSGAIADCSEAAGTCAGPYIEAATLTLLATPAPHQAVTWQGCTPNPNPDQCQLEIGSSQTSVKASFAPLSHTLTVIKAGTGSGSVACNGAPCAASYPEGTVLTLTASPASDSTFAGWTGAGCSGAGTCDLTLEADTHLTATFTANPPPAEQKCVVPALSAKTLAQARSALTAAHCTLGAVTKPKKKKGPLIVKSSSPAAGTTLPAASKVDLTLGPKPKKKH